MKQWNDLTNKMRGRKFTLSPSVIIMLLVTLALAACSSNPSLKQTEPSSNAAWQAHTKHLQQLPEWKFSGRFGAQTELESWTGSIAWQQNKSQYKINIAGPLGMGSLILEGKDNHASLKLSDERSFFDVNPQALLQQHTGLKLPVTELRYWLLGLPAPNNKYSSTLNKNGQLSSLKQNNWTLQFKRYTTVNNIQLPNKVFLVNHDINVRLIIQQWQFPS